MFCHLIGQRLIWFFNLISHSGLLVTPLQNKNLRLEYIQWFISLWIRQFQKFERGNICSLTRTIVILELWSFVLDYPHEGNYPPSVYQVMPLPNLTFQWVHLSFFRTAKYSPEDDFFFLLHQSNLYTTSNMSRIYANIPVLKWGQNYTWCRRGLTNALYRYSHTSPLQWNPTLLS